MPLLLVHQSLQHRRFGEILGLVAPLLLAPELAPQLAMQAGRAAASRLDRLMLELARPAGACAVILVFGLSFVLAVSLPARKVHPDNSFSPAAAVRAAAAQHIRGQVLNDYGFGGYLIFRGITPFIDGRAELYGDAFIQRYTEAVTLTSGELPEILDENKITWTLFDPRRPAVRLLDRLPGWQRLYSDEVAVVHVRKDAAAVNGNFGAASTVGGGG